MFKITLHPFLTDSCRSRKCLTLLKPSLTAVLAMIPVGFLPLRFLQNEQLHWLQHGGHTDTERELEKFGLKTTFSSGNCPDSWLGLLKS